MISIRKYRQEDKQALRRICIETSKLPIETQKQRDFLTLMYNDYYTEVEADNCFVAADENDCAVGYIICSENFKEYYKVFRKSYLPRIRNLGFNYYFMALCEIMAHRLYCKKHPAHLHIDILDTCQGQGVGTRLVSELKAHLSQKGVHSLMLSCGASNEQAVRFYYKNGFRLVKDLMGSYIMAIDF